MKMRDPKDLPTAEEVRGLFAYSPLTGELIWKPRPVTRYRGGARNRAWNRLWAGKTAGGPDANGYWRVAFLGQTHYAHRVIYLLETGEWPPGELDHANGNPSDNRFWNIRLASRSENLANQRLSRKNTSGFKGVHFSKNAGRYVARIKVNKRLVSIGCFDTPEEAGEAYWEAARKHFGPFARAA